MVKGGVALGFAALASSQGLWVLRPTNEAFGA